MNRKTIYKYFNLIIKVLIGVTAFGFIVFKLKDGLNDNLRYLNSTSISYNYISFCLLLMLVNWGIESFKWKFLIGRLVSISFFQAFKFVLTGITVSLVTPNRVGEIPGRVFLLNEPNKVKDLVWLTTMGSFSQLIITLVIGFVGVYLTRDIFALYLTVGLLLILSVVIILTIGLFLFFQKIPKLLNKVTFFEKIGATKSSQLSLTDLVSALVISAVRYGVFCIQYWLILKAFNIELILISEIMLIPVCFLIASIIPTILLSEIGVRSSVAIFVFGMISDNVMAIVISSLLLWTINIALPGLLGMANLKQLKILKV